MEYSNETRTGDRNGGTGASQHILILDGRKRLEITGVKDVVRFDDLSAEFLTDLGTLAVDGEDLRMEVFDTAKAIVTLCGSVRTLDYYDPAASSDTKKKRSLFGRKTDV
ncbi:MAG: YabP/YqfC family sporulation protein [Clostridia bacterium]|nr:YabP/YqfC family sporulation protein [Clostridia bacterium]